MHFLLQSGRPPDDDDKINIATLPTETAKGQGAVEIDACQGLFQTLGTTADNRVYDAAEFCRQKLTSFPNLKNKNYFYFFSSIFQFDPV